MPSNNQLSPGTPLLSVVMPVYKVEKYLRLAVDSVLGQTYRNLEVILVDDGSPDSCGEICDEYAVLDARVKVIHQINGGLSNARNNGAAVATGEYLTFIDSDDELWDNSYARMMRSARETGSEIVTGNVHRMSGSGRRWQAWNQKLSHTRDVARTTLVRTPELIYDGTAWNKLFMRSFWAKHNFKFPEGMLYEDMLPMYQALRAASSIDILTRPVYKWRMRVEKNSITQQRGELKSLHDRFYMMRAIHTDLIELGDDALLKNFYTKAFDGDLWLHVEFVSDTSADYNQLLSEAVAYFWPHVSDEIKLTLPQERRPLFSALARDRACEVPQIREWYKLNRYHMPTVARDNKLYIKDWPAPRFIRVLSDSERELNHETAIDSVVTHLEWLDESTFRIHGWAYIPFVSVGDQKICVFATSGKDRVDCVLLRVPSPEAYVRGKDPDRSYANVGFIADVDVNKIAAASALDMAKKPWRIHVEVSSPAVTRTQPLERIWRGGSAPVIGAQFLADGRRVVPVASAGQILRLEVRNPSFVMKRAVLRRRQLHAEIALPADSRIKSVKLVSPDSFHWAEVSWRQVDDTSLELSVDIPQIDEFRWLTWSFELHDEHQKREVAISTTTELDEAESASGLEFYRSPRGWARIMDRRHYAVIDRVDVSDALLVTLSGRTTEPHHRMKIGLTVEGQESPKWFDAVVTGHRFSCSFELTETDSYGIRRPWKPAKYVLWAKQSKASKPVRAFIAVDDRTALDFPLRFETSQGRIQFDRARQAGVTLNLLPAIPVVDQGAYGRARAAQAFGEGAAVVPENSVFFRTDMGGSAGDSALYIHKELMRRNLELSLYWGVKDHSVPVPPGGIAVIDGTRTWLEKLARSRFVVNNYGGLWGYAAHPHQTYLQTWHGTPFKVIGKSEWTARGITEEELETKRAESAAWDFLLSPSRYCSELLPNELLFEGPVLELGMPRNDFLVKANADDRRSIRKRLGISETSNVVLYAPTFRESLREDWSAERFAALDLHELRKSLGPDWVILNRGHSFNARARSYAQSRAGVVDVTNYTDISELYVAADICVTDYSSVMFDFAVTGKPLLFFVPDMAEYVASRPTYFDLADVAPSRLCSTFDELLSELLDHKSYFERYGEAYEEFRKTFVPWDDGEAAKRVVDAVFMPHYELKAEK